ncbi:hypothetical protein [Chamaesiphon polymorphus]|nr:hypothetical protein [Chamaesiphon polymorphus]
MFPDLEYFVSHTIDLDRQAMQLDRAFGDLQIDALQLNKPSYYL